MAERAPPPLDETHILHPNNNSVNDEDNEEGTNISHSPNPEPNPDCFCRPVATYVVQVPKDQIYRVPPPENAAIAERRRPQTAENRHKSRKTRKFRPCGASRCRCCCVALFVVVLLLAAAVAATILPVFLDPKDPTFHVERVHVEIGHAPRERVYRMAMRSDNPNARVDLSYAQGGVVSLWYRQQEIAAGKFPAFYHSHGSSAAFEAVIRGGAWAKENGTRGTGRVGVTLRMNKLSARREVWTWNTGSVKLYVVCDLTVDSLEPKDSARLLSQECRTKLLSS